MDRIEDWLRLWHIPGVGPRTFNFLLNKLSTPTNIFQASYADLISQSVSSRIAQAIIDDHSSTYNVDLEWLHASPKHHIVTISASEYPHLLKQIFDPPPIIYAWGNLSLLNYAPRIAIVGGRKATTLGKTLAFEFSQQLSQLGITIVSGLARGIDGEAHKGALSNTGNNTIAVLANGLDSIYPSEHSSLNRRIVSSGLLLSEFPIGVKPLPQHFPRRNRIISGLSLGTIVIEAAAKSGSLITARYALEHGREVFAVPGPINNPLNAGCHGLIQDGAKLTTCIDDILVELKSCIELEKTDEVCSKSNHVLAPTYKTLLTYLEHTPMSIEALIEKSGLTPEQVSSMLTELEIGGRVVSDAYGQYIRA